MSVAMGPRLVQVEGSLDHQTRRFRHNRDFAAYRREVEPLLADRKQLTEGFARLSAARQALPGALARLVGQAIDQAEGAEVVAGGLAEVLILDSPAPEPPGELAEVDGKLARLGADEGGQVATKLRASREELAGAHEAALAGHRERIRASARSLVDRAADGDVPAWKRLAETARDHAEAFTGDLAGSLAGCPLAAVLEVDPVAFGNRV